MIHCNTQFGKLKEVVVGREINSTRRLIDYTFRNVYNEDFYDRPDIRNGEYSQYNIAQDILDQRNCQLDNLAKLLTELGVKVYRPESANPKTIIQTPTFQSEQIVTGNVRDITFIYNDTIVETPICMRNRVYENLCLYKIFAKKFDHGNGGKWIKAPNTQLTEDTYNLIVDWNETGYFNKRHDQLEMAIDAPNFLPIGKDVLVNIATDTQYLGYEWVKSLFPDSKFHIMKCTEAHLDGEFMCLKPGVFLANKRFVPFINQLPEKFQKWKFLIPENLPTNIDVSRFTDIGIRLASSSGMDVNVLSLDENTVLVSKRAIGTKKILEKNGFSVIDVELDYGEVFSGGIHCSTLDLIRDDNYDFYT